MPKRRAASDEDEVSDNNAHKSVSEEEVVKKPKKSSAKSEKTKASTTASTCVTPIHQPAVPISAQAQPSKKQKKGKETTKGTTTADGELKTNEEGDKYIDLGRNRRATARVFKGTSLHDTGSAK